jgi:hypothetical protein
MPRSNQCLATLAVAACGLALVGGCGPSGDRLPETGATLEGTVTYGREPVLVAMIIIQGEGGASTAFVDDGGRYKAENVPLGKVQIAINTAAGKGQMTGKVMAQSQGKGGKSAPKMIDVPARFADPSTSGITTTIKKGENNFDVVIPK